MDVGYAARPVKSPGAALMGILIAESERRGLPLSLHLERTNPVPQFYRRLGFVEGAEHRICIFMERKSTGPPKPGYRGQP